MAYTLQRGKIDARSAAGKIATRATAIRDFMAEPPFAGRLPIFLGDDRTDEHGFAAVGSTWRLSIKVGQGATPRALSLVGH